MVTLSSPASSSPTGISSLPSTLALSSLPNHSREYLPELSAAVPELVLPVRPWPFFSRP